MPERAQYWIEEEGGTLRVMQDEEEAEDGACCIDEFASRADLVEWIEGWEEMARELRAALELSDAMHAGPT